MTQTGIISTKKNPDHFSGFFYNNLPGSVLLSHDIPRTIIGAEAFHGPVRNGKGWVHLAIATKQNLSGRKS